MFGAKPTAPSRCRQCDGQSAFSTYLLASAYPSPYATFTPTPEESASLPDKRDGFRLQADYDLTTQVAGDTVVIERALALTWAGSAHMSRKSMLPISVLPVLDLESLFATRAIQLARWRVVSLLRERFRWPGGVLSLVLRRTWRYQICLRCVVQPSTAPPTISHNISLFWALLECYGRTKDETVPKIKL